MWPNPQEIANLVTFTAEILNGKLHILCSVNVYLNGTLVRNKIFCHFWKSRLMSQIIDAAFLNGSWKYRELACFRSYY